MSVGSFVSYTDAEAMARKPSKTERISQGVYGTSDALDKGRVDVADVIIKDTKQLVAPPKKPLNIQELSKSVKDPQTKVVTKTKYVVLPAKMDGTVIRRDSEEFQALLQDRELLKKYVEGEKAWQKYSVQVDKTLQEEAKIKGQLEETIVKKEEKIDKLEKTVSALKPFKWFIMFGGGILLVFIGLYFLSIVVRLVSSVAGMFS